MSSITQTVQSSTTIQEPSTTVYCDSPLPDHTQLPDKDGSFVKNYQEPPQADLLTDTITPLLEQLHPRNYGTALQVKKYENRTMI